MAERKAERDSTTSGLLYLCFIQNVKLSSYLGIIVEKAESESKNTLNVATASMLISGSIQFQCHFAKVANH